MILLLTLCYIHTHTYIYIHMLLPLGPLVVAAYDPTGILRRSRCIQIFSPKIYQYSTTQVDYSYSVVSQWYKMQQQSLRSHRNELHNSPVRKHVILLQQGQFALRTSRTVARDDILWCERGQEKCNFFHFSRIHTPLYISLFSRPRAGLATTV